MSSRQSHNAVALSICTTIVCAEIAAMLLVAGPTAGAMPPPATPAGVRCESPSDPAAIAPRNNDNALPLSI